MTPDEDLNKLEETRKNLLDKAIELRDQLKEYFESSRSQKKSVNLNEIITKQKPIPTENSDEMKNIAQIKEMTQTVVGINYRNVNKKWLGDKIWQYKATVEMKELQFKLEVTIDQQEQGVNEILDITCHLKETEIGYLQEISPWVLALTKIKNLSFLMSVFSDYSHQCSLRKKILKKLKNKNIVTIENGQDERGGLIACLHLSKSADKVYAKFLWRTQLTPRTETIDHIFTIEEIDDGFLEANRQLMKNLCKKTQKKDKLEELWNNLCVAIDEYSASKE
ncbi:uncharacterized protein LOC123264588 [Cotesia glomerata]|uniref:uncharacterized protein LOC123264588 n=1 Tax=Cotesia glomerata TaxID=32391 RepID=UPI001D01541F|nr:uncharacterized protein LOC123264588 [Cotesia glomerata]